MFKHKLLGTIEKDVFYTRDNDPARSLDIYYPDTMDDNSPWPVVVNIHGGAWSMGTKDWAWYSEDLAKLGILGVSINYRLSPDVIAPTHVEDCKCAIRFLRANAKLYNLDAERIGVMGHSAGGHLASLIALTGGLGLFNDKGGWQGYSDEVTVAVSCSGPSNMTKQAAVIMDSQEISDFWQALMGTTDIESLIYREFSPITYVNQNAPPFLLVHGSEDDTVNISESKNLHEALLQFGNQSELLIVERGNHLFEVNGISQDHAIKEKIVPFLLKYLK